MVRRILPPMNPTSSESGGVLFLSATLGDGHHSAAVAVRDAVSELAPTLKTDELDFFDLVSPAMNKAIRRSYILSVRHAPSLYEAFYRSSGYIRPDSAFQKWLNSLGRKEIARLLADRSPKMVVNTFPTPLGAISSLRAMGRTRVPSVAVVTDYSVHSQWLHPQVDRYYVGSEELKEAMIGRGIPGETIEVTGIPVRLAFQREVDTNEVRHRFGIREGPVVLVMAGAYGMIGGFDAVVAELVRSGPPATYVAIAGHDSAIHERLIEVSRQARHPLIPIGYTDRVAELMAVADILVSKPGGLTVSESMARGLPMAIFRPIPGQEMANLRLVLSRGAGFHARTVTELKTGLRRFFQDEEVSGHMRDAARKLGRPKAAFTIARDVLGRI